MVSISIPPSVPVEGYSGRGFHSVVNPLFSPFISAAMPFFPCWNAECVQTDASWGQGFHSHGDENIVINTVAAHRDHSVIFILFIKDALLILIRTVRPPALITSLPLPASALGSLSRSPANYRTQIKGHTWFSKVNILTWELHHPHRSCYRSIIALLYSPSTPPGNPHQALDARLSLELCQSEQGKSC